MFCTYGFQRDADGCEVCECDWSPISENIQCSERIPCPGTRVCNSKVKLCESVNPDRVNWFVYDFEIQTGLLRDSKFVDTFKSGLIHNIAEKYGLEVTQIAVSDVEPTGMVSFQIMPFYAENMKEFEEKINQVDLDLNSHEFRRVLPAVVTAIDGDDDKDAHKSFLDRLKDKWQRCTMTRRPFVSYAIGAIIGCVGVMSVIMLINMLRRPVQYANLSDSKLPIYEPPYHQSPSDDDFLHAVHAPDGTAYVVVRDEDPDATNDKRALV